MFFEHFPVAFLYPFSSAQRLSNSLQENFPAAIGKKRAISVHCPRSSVFTMSNIKKQNARWEILTIPSCSTYNTDLSNVITLSQSQSRVTVPSVFLSPHRPNCLWVPEMDQGGQKPRIDCPAAYERWRSTLLIYIDIIGPLNCSVEGSEQTHSYGTSFTVYNRT
jgi:hypothetical protein